MTELKLAFPEEFFKEEDRLGFHIDRKRKEIWAVELDMLFELERVCKKLNIRYFLDGGTLLGAARDGRFIPWDDDIDVAMLREDYDRFLKEAPGEFEYPLFLQTGYSEKDYFRGHCQLRNSETCAILPRELGLVNFNQGIFVDIFVLDELFPEQVEEQYSRRDALWDERRLCNDRSFRGHPIRWIAKQIRSRLYQQRLGPSEKMYSAMESIFRSDRNSEFVDYLMLNNSVEEIHCLERRWYADSVSLPFEGAAFPAPQGFRDYLAAYYGSDWMTPKQKPSMHNEPGQVIYDTCRSYREVIEEIERTPELYYNLISQKKQHVGGSAMVNSNPKVSVIMPSLNVAEYIRECIESVIGQTLREIEIICVDAGSTDGTLEILQEYAEKDSRIQLLHSDVRSYGHQVNMGFDAAAGEYIAIVETDDYIDAEMYRKMYTVAANAGYPDIVKSPYYCIHPQDADIEPEDVAGCVTDQSGVSFPLTIECVIQEKTGAVFPLSKHYDLILCHPSIWSCIYKKSYLDGKNIRMKECPGAGWVDNPFLYQTMCETWKICWVGEPFYYYRQTNPNASSHLKDCSIPMARINDIKDYLEEKHPGNWLLEKHLFYRALQYIEGIRDNPYLTAENKRQIRTTVRRFRPDIVIRIVLGRQYRTLLRKARRRQQPCKKEP